MREVLEALAFLIIVAAPVLAVIALNIPRGQTQRVASGKEAPYRRTLEQQMDESRSLRARYLRSLVRSAKSA